MSARRCDHENAPTLGGDMRDSRVEASRSARPPRSAVLVPSFASPISTPASRTTWSELGFQPLVACHSRRFRRSARPCRASCSAKMIRVTHGHMDLDQHQRRRRALRGARGARRNSSLSSHELSVGIARVSDQRSRRPRAPLRRRPEIQASRWAPGSTAKVASGFRSKTEGWRSVE